METDLKVSKLSSPNKYGFLAIVFILVLLSAGLLYYRSTQTTPASAAVTPITRTMLEQQYGLRVNLIALTAAGGMIDVRLKIVDGEKAKTLLQDKGNFPALQLSKRGPILKASEDEKSQEIQFEGGGNLFLLYSNQGNVVKPGASVRILFGDTALEPIQVK
jgi:hypothetical protein